MNPMKEIKAKKLLQKMKELAEAVQVINENLEMYKDGHNEHDERLDKIEEMLSAYSMSKKKCDNNGNKK